MATKYAVEWKRKGSGHWARTEAVTFSTMTEAELYCATSIDPQFDTRVVAVEGS